MGDIINFSQRLRNFEQNRGIKFRVFFAISSHNNTGFLVDKIGDQLNALGCDCDFNCNKTSRIDTEIEQAIDKCDLFVADITFDDKIDEKYYSNPNVMFEIGYARAKLLEHQLLLVCSQNNLDDLPFNIRTLKSELYDPTDIESLSSLIQERIHHLIDLAEHSKFVQRWQQVSLSTPSLQILRDILKGYQIDNFNLLATYNYQKCKVYIYFHGPNKEVKIDLAEKKLYVSRFQFDLSKYDTLKIDLNHLDTCLRIQHLLTSCAVEK